MIYLPYGIVQSIIISQIGGSLLGEYALFLTCAGAAISWAVRMAADKLIKSGKINEDQLTGAMLPLMALSYIGLFLSPFDLTFTSRSIPLLASILGAYISTPALGTVENTRMQNKTVSFYTELIKATENDPNLTDEEKQELIRQFNAEINTAKTKASAHYNVGNSSALYPVLALAAAALIFFGNSEMKTMEDIPQLAQKLPEIANWFNGVNITEYTKDPVSALMKLSFFVLF